jgi:alcohol dehydrogenase (cytochrome c)
LFLDEIGDMRRRDFGIVRRAPLTVANRFAAYNSSNGKELWNFRAGAGVNAPPSTYMVGGKQYVVVGAGGNTQIDFHRGNNIIAFTLN